MIIQAKNQSFTITDTKAMEISYLDHHLYVEVLEYSVEYVPSWQENEF